jgi:hypothetical protein
VPLAQAPEFERVAPTPTAPSLKPPARTARATAREAQAPIRGNPSLKQLIPIADFLDCFSLASSTDR